MQLVTMRTNDGTRAGRVEDDSVVALPYKDVGELLRSDAEWPLVARQTRGVEYSLQDCDLAPVVLRPGKIVCLGLNYRGHILEMGRELPEYPTLFAKFSGALIGPYDPIQLPDVSDQVDWEAELGLIIGRTARRVSAKDAAASIAGFVVANDVTVRDWQHRTREFLSGKTFEGTTPIGPGLVTADGDIGPAPDLRITCEVDGAVMQESRTSELLFSPPQIVSYVSEIITLDPGDLILTGTPGGVGVARTPPVFLRDGISMRTQIEGIGELVNSCVLGVRL